VLGMLWYEYTVGRGSAQVTSRDVKVPESRQCPYAGHWHAIDHACTASAM